MKYLIIGFTMLSSVNVNAAVNLVCRSMDKTVIVSVTGNAIDGSESETITSVTTNDGTIIAKGSYSLVGESINVTDGSQSREIDKPLVRIDLVALDGSVRSPVVTKNRPIPIYCSIKE